MNNTATDPISTDRHSPVSRFVTRPQVEIEVLDQGSGPVIVMLPSLGRAAEDFHHIATRVAQAGFRVLRPQPRGIGGSRGAMAGIDLHDLSNDIAAVIENANAGPAFVVGHAFGNRVARLLATDRPDLVRGISLIAANVGIAPSPPPVREAIKKSANSSLPDEERIAALQFAFFAPGNNPRSWLSGWYPEVLAMERTAGDKTRRDEDYAGGRAPILYLQPSHDPLAHAEDAIAFKEALGDRVEIVTIPNASHAAITEQPEFIADALIDYVERLPGKGHATKSDLA